MEEALAKIRPHTSSSLPHQKSPATLLVAVESTFKDQNAEPTPTAYFAAFLTTLDATIQKRDTSLNEGDVLPAQLYLLALVAPFVPQPVVQANLNILLSLTAPLFPNLLQHAPPLRSQLSLYHAIFHALDRSQLDIQGIRQSFASILNLVVDPRPKVRKKAVDVVKDVLLNPPAPLLRHPYADRVAEWIKVVLAEVASGPLSKGKLGKQVTPSTAETGIHIIAFIRPILLTLPTSVFPSITNILLQLSRLGNAYLTQTSYSLLSDLFILPTEDSSTNIADQLIDVLKTVLAAPPTKQDAALAPTWVRVLSDAMQAYKLVNPEGCTNEVGRVWKAIWNFLETDDQTTRKAAASSLDAVCGCFSTSLISTAVSDMGGSSTLRKIVAQVTKALDSLQYARAIPELLSVISSLIQGLSYRIGGRQSATASEVLLAPLIQHVGELRTQKQFEYKESADSTLTTAMRVLGPEVLLGLLPLNLEPKSRQAGEEPRAFLLPLLANPHPSPLSHFVKYFLPLSEQMFDLQQKAEEEGRQSEAKVWNVLVGQVWSGFVGYCYCSPDLPEALTTAFSQLLSQLLYTQPSLRPSILKALKTVVDSNVTASSSKTDGSTSSPFPSDITPDEAASNIAFLRTQAASWLAILFNIYGSVGRDFRGSVGDVITSWASIAGEQEITSAYNNVVQILRTNVKNISESRTGNTRIEKDNIGMTSTALDILILLLPYMSSPDCTSLFDLILSPEVLSSKDNAVQKRGYKLLTKLVESRKVKVDAAIVLKKLDELTDVLTPAAKKDRLSLLTLLVPAIPATEMHIIPSLIPEAVLGTKEPSEKSRNAAFDLIVAMGQKMSAGGVVKRRLMDGMDEDNAEDATANIEEFMTMIAGGLAGASPHMISATITAISRLVFEFKDEISPKMHTEIITTLLVFVSSANREIVKSSLGFVKLAIHTLPVELLRPHLATFVPALLSWSHDHKNHFKVKVRHIFERMLRRFPWDEVYSAAGGVDSAKVLVNIKKRKDRAKRKKANRAEGEEEEETPKPVTGDAFEDVLYGSENELSDSDDEAPATQQRKPKRTNEFGARLRVDDDEPMDLLQGAASRITNAGGAKRRKPGQDASRFKTDEDTGKMVIDEHADSDDDTLQHATDVAGDAYRETLTSVDGFTRGVNGQIKFNKDTKKRRREIAEETDVEMVDAEELGHKKKSKQKTEFKLGKEFKAKKAGGDVKKDGVDPYAYLTLSQAAKRKGKGKIGIAGKR